MHVDRKQSLAAVDTVDTAVQANYLAVAPGEVKATVVCIAHITVLVCLFMCVCVCVCMCMCMCVCVHCVRSCGRQATKAGVAWLH